MTHHDIVAPLSFLTTSYTDHPNVTWTIQWSPWEVARPREYISSFLPHVIRPREEVHGKQLASMIKRQLNYNVWLTSGWWRPKVSLVMAVVSSITDGPGRPGGTPSGNSTTYQDRGMDYIWTGTVQNSCWKISSLSFEILRQYSQTALIRATTWSKEIIQAVVQITFTRYAHQRNKVVTASFTPDFTTLKQHTLSLWLKIVRIL